MTEQQTTPDDTQNEAGAKTASAPKTEEITVDGITMIKTEFGKKRNPGIHRRTLLIDKYGTVFTSTISGDKEKSTIKRTSVRWREDYDMIKRMLVAIYIPLRPDDHMLFFGDDPQLYHSVVRHKKKSFPLAAIYADYGQLGNQNKLSEEDRETYATTAMSDLLSVYTAEEVQQVLEEAWRNQDFNLSQQTLEKLPDYYGKILGRPIVDIFARTVTINYCDTDGQNFLVIKDYDTGLTRSHYRVDVDETRQES